MTTITDRHTGLTDAICRTYRVLDGQARLFVAHNRNIWIGYGANPVSFSLVATARDWKDSRITKNNACCAANYY